MGTIWCQIYMAIIDDCTGEMWVWNLNLKNLYFDIFAQNHGENFNEWLCANLEYENVAILLSSLCIFVFNYNLKCVSKLSNVKHNLLSKSNCIKTTFSSKLFRWEFLHFTSSPTFLHNYVQQLFEYLNKNVSQQQIAVSEIGSF